MNERELINTLSTVFAHQEGRIGKPFECDAERFKVGDELWAVNIDEFSQREDFFQHDDPAVIGANVAVATLSDLYAAGAEPRFFLQALATDDVAFARAFAEGMRSVLKEAGCLMLGGDVGRSAEWRCTGVALGPIPQNELHPGTAAGRTSADLAQRYRRRCQPRRIQRRACATLRTAIITGRNAARNCSCGDRHQRRCN